MCAAVDKIEEKRKPEDFVGYRKRFEYQPIISRCIVRAAIRWFESNRGRQKSRMRKRSGFYFFTVHFSLFTKFCIRDFWKVIGNSE